jgi:hypothetical protein
MIRHVQYCLSRYKVFEIVFDNLFNRVHCHFAEHFFLNVLHAFRYFVRIVVNIYIYIVLPFH